MAGMSLGLFRDRYSCSSVTFVRPGDPRAGCAEPQVTVVVPLFNEEVRLAERGPQIMQWTACHALDVELILVDDGSSDATVEVARKVLQSEGGDVTGTILTLPHRGKGAAVAAGIAAASGRHVGFLDVDLSTPLYQFEMVLKAAMQNETLAIASRDARGARVVVAENALRECLGRQYNRLLRITLTPGIRDTQCGAKAAPAWLWRAVADWPTEKGWAWDVEVIARARRLGHRIVEVPVIWQHDPRSQVRVVTDGLAMLWAIPRIRLRMKRWRPSPTLISSSARPGGPRKATPVAGSEPAEHEAARLPLGPFDSSTSHTLLDHDNAHWWFRCKSAMVSTLLEDVAPADNDLLVDIGAGAGGVTKQLSWKGRKVTVDATPDLVSSAASRDLLSLRGLGEALPIRNSSAAVVCLLDVIEHIIDPSVILSEAARILRPGGRLMVTVPAHEWLHSSADDYLGHVRRYDQRLLRDHLRAGGFELLYSRHVFSWLVPPVWLMRKVARPNAEQQLGLGVDGKMVGRLADILTNAELRLLQFPSPPVGTTILAVATSS